MVTEGMPGLQNFLTHPFVTQTSHFFTYSPNRRQKHKGPLTHNGKHAREQRLQTMLPLFLQYVHMLKWCWSSKGGASHNRENHVPNCYPIQGRMVDTRFPLRYKKRIATEMSTHIHSGNGTLRRVGFAWTYKTLPQLSIFHRTEPLQD